MDLVFDIETDGLLVPCKKLWCVCAEDVETGESFAYGPGDNRWAYLLENADSVSGHNIAGFDLPALGKLTGFSLPESVAVYDTLVLSRVLDYRRFGFKGHSLAVWGEHLGFPKIEFNEWHQFSSEMLTYCKNDVSLNVQVYKTLAQELDRKLASPAVGEKLRTYIKAEHVVSEWSAMAELNGWPFDKESGEKLMEELENEIYKATAAIQPLLGMKVVAVDKVKDKVEVKNPKWTKDGFYYSRLADWFDISPIEGHPSMSRPIEGDYCRIETKALSLSSVQDVKLFLTREGWKPTDFNYKRELINGRTVSMPTSPKITEDSLEFMGATGQLYMHYLTVTSRLSILKTWLENLDDAGNLHGNCNPIGTPSMRSTHSVIVNVPSIDKPYGAEMRRLFKAKPGWVIVGCDSKGNQARGLAHYLGDEEFIHVLLNEDIHVYNAKKLTKALNKLQFTTDVLLSKGLENGEVSRSAAKRVFYALLFGASGTKLWAYIFKEMEPELGKSLKNAFLKEVPGFAELIKKLNKVYSMSINRGVGYIPSIAGNRIYVDSRHKLLVYLLQACEKVTCATALMITQETLKSKAIPFIPLVMYHDEFQVMVPKAYGELVKEIGQESFKEGPKLYGIEIMDGDGKVGLTWEDTH